MSNSTEDLLDLLIVGAGPTGLAAGAAAKEAGLSTLILDRGGLCSAIQRFPSHMLFFTTRDKLEIAGLPFTIPDDKPDRRQALIYYQGVARRHDLPLALYEEVLQARRVDDAEGGHFVVESLADGIRRERRARSVALATGYFDQPQMLGVPGEELPWVDVRYNEPYAHFDQRVVLIGGGNTSCEAALDLWRNGAGRVTIVHRRAMLKPTVKYWVKPDVENRIEEGSIDGVFEASVRELREREAGGKKIREVVLDTPTGERVIACDHAYVLIGYTPDANLERRCGIDLDPETLVPVFDRETCETNVPGLYVMGTLQSGRDTGKIFIENSRDHGERVVQHLLSRRPAAVGT